MKTKPFLSLLLATTSLLLFSCKKELEPQDSIPTPKSTVDSTSNATNATEIAPNQTTQQPGQLTNTPGMNPAHGQPGHRCDIQVGSPLNSPVNKTAQPNTTPTIQQQVITPEKAVAKTNTAPGMNPPHGQPGHRCDISVGKPLNTPASKVVSPQATSSINQAGNTPLKITQAVTNKDGNPSIGQDNSNSSTPAVLSTTTTAPGMNPPHGQPGHVCGTAVGAPLPKP